MSPTFTRSLIVCVVLVLALPRCDAYRATVVIGEVAQRDMSRLTYFINMPRLGEQAPPQSPPPGTSRPLQVVTARGQTLNCLLPDNSPSSSAKSPAPEPSDAELLAEMDRILAQYRNKCYVRKEDWWTYEFCFGKHVVQKHVIPTDRDPFKDEAEDKFDLGLYKPQVDLARRADVARTLRSDGLFTQHFVDGTICDTTGKKRHVLVKFICGDDAVQLGGSTASSSSNSKLSSTRPDFLKAVREVKSCVYEIEFMNSAVCQHPAYRAKVARTERSIHCALADETDVFVGLSAPDYEPAFLSV